MNADHSRRTFLLGGLATGAVLLAGKPSCTLPQPTPPRKPSPLTHAST